MAKNISWRLSTLFPIPPEHQYFHLGHEEKRSALRIMCSPVFIVKSFE